MMTWRQPMLAYLPLSASSQYAISSLTKYLLAAVGIVLAFNALGVDWSKVQWLVAAMTLGLAIGLQEIFANFVSGIIILFERPIRVGDVVTVGPDAVNSAIDRALNANGIEMAVDRHENQVRPAKEAPRPDKPLSFPPQE